MPPSADAPPPFVPPYPELIGPMGAPLYLTGEDALRVTVFNAAAGVTVTITGRTIPFGEKHPVPFSQSFTPATDRSVSTTQIQLNDGWLLNAQAIVSAGSPGVGQCFARLSLVRGAAGLGGEFYTLGAGYITARQTVAWPGAGVSLSTYGEGALRSISGANPGLGFEISETVPTGARWELVSFRCLFTTNAVAGNRLPALTLDDGTNEYFRGPIGVVIPTTIAAVLTFAQGLNRYLDPSTAVEAAGVPIDNRLLAGHRIRTNTINIQGGDVYTNIQYVVREWIEGA